MIDWTQKKTRLDDDKRAKVAEINAVCESVILGGFGSAALGAAHAYDSSERDQINLVGAGNAGIDLPYTCTDSAGLKAEKLHTAAQIKQAYLDGLAFKSAQLSKARTLKASIDAAATVAKVNAIKW